MKTQLKNILLALSLIAASSAGAEEFVYVDIDGDGYLDAVPAGQPIVAPLTPPICGGADDDQSRRDPTLCGGADDDQIVGGDGADFVRQQIGSLPLSSPGNPLVPVVKSTGNPIAGGLGNDTLTQPTSSGIMGAGLGGGPNLSPDPAQWPAAVAPAGVNGLVITNPAGGNILTAQPVNGIVVTSPGDGGILTDAQLDMFIMDALRLGPICGGNGNDSIVVAAGQQPVGSSSYTDSAGAWPLAAQTNRAPFTANQSVTGAGVGGASHLTGDAGEDLTDKQILELMSTGRLHGDDDSDTLWAGGGTDEIILTQPGDGSI